LNAAACKTVTPRCVRSVQSFELGFLAPAFETVFARDFAPVFLTDAAFSAPGSDDFTLIFDVPRLRGDVFLVATILSV
jgi:hypothetical protein